jgi:hypothetical protein
MARREDLSAIASAHPAVRASARAGGEHVDHLRDGDELDHGVSGGDRDENISDGDAQEPARRQQAEEDRPDEIEMLFDREGPGMAEV